MKVLVTGARGFVGKAIVEKLRRSKIEVIEIQSQRLDERNDLAENEIYKFNKFKVDITKKDEVLKSIIAKHDLLTRGSIAVGDTSRDIVMFDMVAQPIAFNPNQALFKIAREKGWMVVLERKDVVYGMQQINGEYVLKSVNV